MPIILRLQRSFVLLTVNDFGAYHTVVPGNETGGLGKKAVAIVKFVLPCAAILQLDHNHFISLVQALRRA
jgi:hypothetical protein